MQDYNFTIRKTSQLPKEENYILIFEMDCINIPHKIFKDIKCIAYQGKQNERNIKNNSGHFCYLQELWGKILKSLKPLFWTPKQLLFYYNTEHLNTPVGKNGLVHFLKTEYNVIQL